MLGWRLWCGSLCVSVLTSLAAYAGDEGAEPAARAPGEGGEGGEGGLPDALPPLDERLLQVPGAPPVRAFAQARLRGELDDSRDLARVDDTALGATITGRVGVEASASSARAMVVVGDGGRLGQRVDAPPLVTRPIASPLYQAELALDVSLVGFPAVVSLGRAPLVIADGRWVGSEPWDARGRTLDGARASVHGEGWDLLAAAIWLGPAGLDARELDGNPSGLAVVSARARPIDVVWIDVYGFVHRDGADLDAPLTTPTMGARSQATLGFLELRAGADVQGTVTDERSVRFFAGTSGHAEASARASTVLSGWSPLAPDPFVVLAAEATGGEIVYGRSWRAPAPTQHGALGLMDFFAPDNTWSASLAFGGTTPGGLLLEGAARVVGLLDQQGLLLDPEGKAVARRAGAQGIAFAEADARLMVPLRGWSALGVEYAIGVPGGLLSGDAPAQRLMVTLKFAADSDERGTLPPLD